MIYLIHSSVVIGGAGRNAGRHYLGYCEDGFIWQRMQAHHTGRSKVSIIRAFQEAGATLYLVRVWPDGGQALERHLKNRGHYKGLCPVCSGSTTEEQSIPIGAVSTLTLRSVKLRSRKQMREALKSDQSGTSASTPGLSTQLAIQVPGEFSLSGTGLSLAIPGGGVSVARAQTNAPGARSAGTKPPLSDSGRIAAYVGVRESLPKLPSDPSGPTPKEMMLELGLYDEEGFQV